MIEVVVAVVIVVAGIAVAAVIRRRDAGRLAQGSRWSVPAQLERRDFTAPGADWLVVGRTVYAAPNPRQAAENILQSLR